MNLSDTHPFINFKFNPDELSKRTWMRLGEAMSKCQHLAGTPLRPAAAREMMQVFLARGIQATTAIEGNTLSEAEVESIVRDGTAALGESRQYLETEVQNILGAIKEIDEALQDGERLPLTVERLQYLNGLVLEGIPDGPEVQPGKFRQHDVRAGTYKAPSWDEVPGLMDQFVAWLASLRSSSADASAEDRFFNAVVSAVLAHLYIAWIHPFGNGNGRLARLVEVQILSESGVVPLVSTNLLSNYYNKTRSRYYVELDHAQRSVAGFIDYAAAGLVDEIRDQIKLVQEQSQRVHWESYVYEVFADLPNTSARDRQRRLILAMPGGEPLGPKQISKLTPELAALYAVAGERTPARDLNDLVKMGLARKVAPRKYVSREEIVRAFLPPVLEEA